MSKSRQLHHPDRRSPLMMLALVLAGLVASFVPPGGASTAEIGSRLPYWDYRAFTMPVYWFNTLYSAGPDLERIAATGANAVVFNTTWRMNDRFDNEVRRDISTADDDSLIWATVKARSVGLKVVYKPHIDPHDGYWRAEISPTNPSLWFQSYRSMIYRHADLARDYGASMLVVGSELISMSTNPAFESEWRTLIAGVRSRWPAAKLTYNANWGRDANEEWSKIKFWDALDYLGISAYFELAGWNGASTWDFINGSPGAEGWVQWNNNKITPFHNDPRWPGKPVIFTEVGYRSVNGAGTQPWNHWMTNTLDLNEQRDLYQALYQYWSTVPWMAGSFNWTWSIQASGAISDTSYEVWNKPAEAMITEWYRPAPALSTLQPSAVPTTTSPLTVTIGGSGFVYGVTKVRWKGVDRPTTFISPTMLAVSVPITDLIAPGTFTMTAISPAPGGGASLPVTFTVLSTPPTVGQARWLLTPAQPAYQVEIAGGGFTPGAIVKAASLDRPATVISGTQLTTTLPLTVTGGMPISVTVRNPGSAESAPLGLPVAGAWTSVLTPTTANVEIALTLSQTLGTAVRMSQVSKGGTIAALVNRLPLSAVPAGVGFLPTTYALSLGTIEFGSATVCLPYDPTEVVASGLSEGGLRLLRYSSSGWRDVTSSVDRSTRTLCGDAASLATYAIGAPTAGQQLITYRTTLPLATR